MDESHDGDEHGEREERHHHVRRELVAKYPGPHLLARLGVADGARRGRRDRSEEDAEQDRGHDAHVHSSDNAPHAAALGSVV